MATDPDLDGSYESRYVELGATDAHHLNGVLCSLLLASASGNKLRTLSAEERQAVSNYVRAYAQAITPDGLRLGDDIERLKVALAD